MNTFSLSHWQQVLHSSTIYVSKMQHPADSYISLTTLLESGLILRLLTPAGFISEVNLQLISRAATAQWSKQKIVICATTVLFLLRAI